MIKIAICDDIKDTVDEIKELLKCYYANNAQHEYGVYGFYTAETLLDSVCSGEIYNVLFMDINLEENGKEVLGTEIASAIKKLHPDMLIIYISYFDYYREMVQAEPFKFLNKPISKDYFIQVMDAAHERLRAYHFSYSFNNEVYTVDLREVCLLRSVHRKVYIKKQNGEETCFYGKLDDVEKEIESICSMFARVNKSYLVNVCCVDRFTQNSISVNEEYITISRKYKEKFRKEYLNKIIHFAR